MLSDDGEVLHRLLVEAFGALLLFFSSSHQGLEVGAACRLVGQKFRFRNISSSACVATSRALSFAWASRKPALDFLTS